MKFSIGYQDNDRLKTVTLEHAPQVLELYFPWGAFASGRGTVLGRVQQEKLEQDLADYSAARIPLNLLLNGNCYGRHSLSRSFFQSIGDTVDMLDGRFGLSAVTTASPIIAKFLKRNFPRLAVRASVNMEIGTVEGMDYLLELFDSFYLKRELNQNLQAIRRMREACLKNGRKLLMLANSGCLNYCSARTFHDNLVAHQDEIAEMDNAFEFHSACAEYLAKPEKRQDILCISNFIRPEDVPLYEDLCDGMKLATRVSYNPAAIVGAYMSGRWHGNLLELTEPAHAKAFMPKILDGGRLPAEFGSRRLACNKDCEHCGWCRKALADALIELNADGAFR